MFNQIITSSDKTKRDDYIQKYCQKLSIDPLDITTIEKESSNRVPSGTRKNIQREVSHGTSNSIGIEDIKNMQKKLYFKPIRSPVKAVIIEDAQLLTTEAQNAMLKILEEPPDHTLIILSSSSKEPFLPTIISRCKTIELETEKPKLSVDEIRELTGFIENLSIMPISSKFKKAETLTKDKDKAIEWTANIILLLREKLLEDHSSPEILLQLKNFQKLHTLLKTTNTNPRFAIEHSLLQTV